MERRCRACRRFGQPSSFRSVIGAVVMVRAVADSAVVACARLPRPGLVKTRLAAGVGADAAAEFYRRCAETVIGELGRCWQRRRSSCRCRLLPCAATVRTAWPAYSLSADTHWFQHAGLARAWPSTCSSRGQRTRQRWRRGWRHSVWCVHLGAAACEHATSSKKQCAILA